ncbi:MAG TPA: outer membrane protein assembly factor BamB [Acidiferrobacteraceae bacterium]|nr:outer membrane protein assembly factor BamB [Acidiferrobacteraceae bacterium]
MRRLVVMAAALLLGGCGISRWLSGGTSNAVPPAPLVAFHPLITVQKLWSVRTGKGAGSQYLSLVPALEGDRLYVSDHKGNVAAFEAATGHRLWRVRLKMGVTGAVGAGPGMVFIGGRKGLLVALSAQSGAVLWKAHLSSTVLAPATSSAEGIVVAQTVDGRLAGLSAQDGSLLWSDHRRPPSLSLYASATPVIRQNRAFAAFADGRVYAVHLHTGAPIWQVRLGHAQGVDEIERLADVDTTPIVRDGLVYAAAYQGDVAAIDRHSGKTVWSAPTSTFRNLALGKTQLYLSTSTDAVQARQSATGALMWTQGALSGRRISAPEPIAQEVAVGDYAGYVHWMARTSGQFVARTRVGKSPVRVQPVAAQEGQRPVLFVLEQNGRLTALSPSS